LCFFVPFCGLNTQMKILVTGGAGFIGSSFVRYILGSREDVDVVNFDLLTYAGNLRNLDEVAGNPRYQFVRGDIANPEEVIAALDIDTEASNEARKLARTLHEFDHYIRTNRSSIPNYGDRYRNEEAISSAVAESSVNQIVSKRFVKKQQMRWTRRGAHLLLQIRTQALDDTLPATFQRWYPGMRTDEPKREPTLAAS